RKRLHGGRNYFLLRAAGCHEHEERGQQQAGAIRDVLVGPHGGTNIGHQGAERGGVHKFSGGGPEGSSMTTSVPVAPGSPRRGHGPWMRMSARLSLRRISARPLVISMPREMWSSLRAWAGPGSLPMPTP